jgi:regulator of protease activity HflC (stomatin/prohibitin superfamily)
VPGFGLAGGTIGEIRAASFRPAETEEEQDLMGFAFLQAAVLGFSAILVVIIAIFVAGILISSIKVVKEYERGVIFRVGRVRGGPKGPGLFILLPFIDRMVKVDLRIVTLDVPPQDVITRDNVPARVNAVVYFRVGRVRGGPKGPGLFILLPFIDRMVKVDLRIVTMDVPPQDVITRDNVPARVNAVVYFRVIDPNKSVLEVENHVLATSQISQTTLRSVLGQKDLDNLLINREEINDELQRIIDEQTDPWGIKVSVVEVKDVEIPQQMQRAMARQAESERERRAKIIAAEGEYQASQRLRQAADRLESPQALQLRLFQTMGEIAVNQNSTIILPVPIDLLRPYLSGPDGSRVDYEARAQRERLEEEEEAKHLYEEAVGDVPREAAAEEIGGETPRGEERS